MASLLGKLYISPGSSEDKLRDMYGEISVAVEDGLLTDATSRNALYKIHVSLGKIVNSLDEQQQQQQLGASRSTRSVSVNLPAGDDSKTIGSEETTMIKEQEEDDDDGDDDATVTVVPRRGQSIEEAGDDTAIQDA